MVREPKHLLVFTAVRHSFHNGEIRAHGGFVREIDTWAQVFERVTVAAVSSENAKSDDIFYTQPNIEVTILDRFQRTDRFRKLGLLWKYPHWLYKARRLINAETVVMARGPDYIGFIGFLVTRFNQVPRFAKYADQWSPYSGEPVAYRFQRFLYRSGAFGGPIIVNTIYDPKRPYVVPVYNASISQAEWDRAGNNIRNRDWSSDGPRRILYVGQLGKTKGVDILLKAFRKIIDKGEQAFLDIVGDGPTREDLETLTQALELDGVVTFHGWRSREEVFDFAAKAFCLVNCSYRQGLDKVILEGMAHALPIISTTTSVMPELIEPPSCGLLTPPGDVEGLTSALSKILSDAKLAQEMGVKAREKVKVTFIDEMENKYRNILKTHLKMDV